MGKICYNFSMREVELENLLNDNETLNKTFFHFAPKSAFESINEKGLLALKGKNSQGIEENPKVFFTEGGLNLLRISDIWIKWFAWHIAREKYFGKHYKDWTKEKAAAFKSDFENGKIYTEDIMEKAQNKFLEMTTTFEYYVLDLEEGIDFSYDDIDEVKNRCVHDGILYFSKGFREMYGPYSDFESTKMDKWNMHTFKNKKVSKEKLMHVVSSKYGKDFNMLDMICEVRKKYIEEAKSQIDELTFLNKFLEKIGKIENETTIKM